MSIRIHGVPHGVAEASDVDGGVEADVFRGWRQMAALLSGRLWETRSSLAAPSMIADRGVEDRWTVGGGREEGSWCPLSTLPMLGGCGDKQARPRR